MVWVASGGRETFQKGGGFRPALLDGFPAARGRPDLLQIDDSRSIKKSYIKITGMGLGVGGVQIGLKT